MRRRLTFLAVPLLLAGCQTWGPTWSEVTGSRLNLTVLDRGPTVVERVDGVSKIPDRASGEIMIEPGKRVLTLQAVPLQPGWTGGGSLQDFTLEARPCVRYYVVAQFDNRLLPFQWTPVIDGEETIAGCRVEAKK